MLYTLYIGSERALNVCRNIKINTIIKKTIILTFIFIYNKLSNLIALSN